MSSQPRLAPDQQHPPDMIELFCWVFGDKLPFSVDVSREKTVNGLKEAIVAEIPDRFQCTNAHSLELWKKIISSKEKKKLKSSDLNDDDVLDETWKIGKYFIGDPPEERIHVVIRAPGK